jgi:hypothetical protein
MLRRSGRPRSGRREAAGAVALALAAIYGGASLREAAKIGGVTLQIVRDWALKFNAHGPDGLIDRKSPGQAPRLKDARRGRAGLGPRERSDSSGSLGHTMADRRSLPMDMGGIRCRCRNAAFEPRTARHGLSQAPGPSRILKKPTRAPGANRARKRRRARRPRDLVRGRGAHRPEEQDHATLGREEILAPSCIRSLAATRS